MSLLSLAVYSAMALMLAWGGALYDKACRRADNDRQQRKLALEAKRKELLRTLALREQLLASVSHALRTPMNAILGFNHMLLTRTADHPQALKMLNHTRQSADHLLTVINDVLDDSQRQSEAIKVQPETFALRDTVQIAFDVFALPAQAKQLEYRCTIDDDVPQWMCADRHRLTQILVNLLGNAIKFTHQGHVTLAVRSVPMGVYFSVQDSGVGIPEAQQAKIFQPFTQASDDIHSRYGGHGLGLSITQRWVERMGGQLGFESKSGHGSTFGFTLPCVAAEPAVQETPQARLVAATSQTRLRFLVVDDHPINRLLVCQLLKNHWPDCELVDVDNGQTALEVLGGQVFDAVLMDMVMPDVDGIEATTALRLSLHSPMCDVPVLGLTANVNPQDLERFAAAGVNAVVLKPFDGTSVCAHLEEMLRKKKSSQGS